MSNPMVPDALWERIAPLLRAEPATPAGNRPRIPDRACMTGIIFVLKNGIPCELLPAEMGCGSGMTCGRRLRDGQDVGVWQRLHRALLDERGEADQIAWDRASVDSASVPAKKGASSPDRIRRIAANRARSATLVRTDAGPR